VLHKRYFRVSRRGGELDTTFNSGLGTDTDPFRALLFTVCLAYGNQERGMKEG
jgi:hypothetical protein